MSNITIDSVQEDLKKLGIGNGDTVYFRASLPSIGLSASTIRASLLGTFLEVVGPTGTIAAPTYTQLYPILPPLKKVPQDQIYDQTTHSIVGALSNLFLAHPEHVRSRHPSNSIAAIGANAERLCENHNARTPSYLPMQTLIDLGGKLVLIGCVGTSSGFTTVHWAQYQLGLAVRSILKDRLGIYYRDGSETRLYRRRDLGGCSRGFWKFYAHYVAEEVLTTGRVGNAYSILIAARDAFQIEHALLHRNPRFALCDDPRCLSCRFSWGYNKRDRLGYALRLFTSIVHSE